MPCRVVFAISLCIMLGAPLKPTWAAPAQDWVIYNTEVGWLRVGPRAEYEAKWQKKDEINGGTSEEPLQKDLLAQGFQTRAVALKEVCDHLTKVQLHIAPPAAGGPVRYLTGVFREKEYSLRLTPGFDQETAETMAKTGKFYKALEYDFDSEWKTMRQFNITPRHVFRSKQWLVHSIGHGSVNGPVQQDVWMCVTSKPGRNEKGEGYVVLADGFGGTVTHSIKEAEGPFLDNYTLAAVMKKYAVKQVDLWPPVTSAVGRDVQPRVNADEIPDNPKDYGDAALPMQPLLPNKALLDWVIYAVEDRWLHVGTRHEFKLPLKKSEVIWAGTSEEPAKKTLLAPPEGGQQVFYSRKQALRALVEGLTGISYSFNPTAQPRETITAQYRGVPYHLRLERGGDPDSTVEYQSLAYDAGANISALREVDKAITPRKTFRQQWLVHATGHGTYSGTVKDDVWMMITAAPNTANRSFVVPDGQGGTFGYSYDQARGPFTDSYELVPALREISRQDPRVKSIGLYGEERGLSVADIPEGIAPVDRGTPSTAPNIVLRKTAPEAATQGDELGIKVIGKNIEPGSRFSLGTGITVATPVSLARDADSDFEQWYATVSIDDTAPPGPRTLTIYNPDGGFGTLPKAFTVREASGDSCPKLELVIPADARTWISAATSDDQISDEITDEKQRKTLIARLQAQRGQFFEALAAMGTARDHQESLYRDLRRINRELAGLNVQSDRDAYRKKIIERTGVERALRGEEATYARGMTFLAQTFSEEEAQKFLSSLRERALCLSQKTRDALDDSRNWNYVAYWQEWRLKKYLYDIYKDNLLHTLKIWQNFNAVRQSKMLQLIAETRRARFAATGAIDAAALRPYQRALRDVHIDLGVCGLLYTQTMMEDGMMGQESYLASYKATTQQAQSIEQAKELRWQAEQAMVFSLKYAIALGGDGFKSLTDSAKRIFNAGYGQLAGAEFDTVASDLTKALKDSREKFEWGLRVMDRIRTYSDAQTIALKTREAAGDLDRGLQFLSDDLNFFTQTSGGLRRLAACYAVSLDETMEDEYRIAIDRARRSAADMRRTFNALRGAETSDDFTTWRKLLTAPFGTMKVLLQGTSLGGDQFTGTELYIQNRESQATEMEALLPAVRRVNWEPFRLRDVAPRSFAHYLDLTQNNPHMREWDLTREHIIMQSVFEELDRKLKLAWDNIDKAGAGEQMARISDLQKLNEHYAVFERPAKIARVLQLQGCDRLMVWDYDGALECFYQASENSERVQPRANVEALREELVIRKTKEARLDVIFSLADSIFMSRLYQGMGQWTYKGARRIGLVSERVRKPPLPEAPRGFWTKPLPYVSWIGDQVWGGINPFKDQFSAVAVEREMAALGRATVGMRNIVAQDIATQVIRATSMQWLGVKQEYADFLANAIVNSATVHEDSPDSLDTLLNGAAASLQAIAKRALRPEVDSATFNRRRDARRALTDYSTYLKWVREFRRETEQLNGKSLVAKSDKEIHEATKPAAEAKNGLDSKLKDLTKEVAGERLKALEAVPQTPAGAAERVKLIAEFFRDYPIPAEGGPVRDMLKSLIKSSDADANRLNDRIDEMRWELLSSAMQDFLKAGENASFREMFLNYVFIGAAANKDGKAYRDKKALTDVDFTALLKDTVTNTQRAAFEKAFNTWFESTYKITLGHLDVSVMGDFRPIFHAELESTEALLALNDKAKMDELLKFLERDAEKVRVDAFHGERYYEVGNILYLNLGLKIVGTLKKGERAGNDMANEPQAEVDKFFKGVTVEPWMAFDVAMGQLGFLMRHKELKVGETGEPEVDAAGNLVLKNPIDYHKYLCKYPGTRGLFGLLLLSKPARQMLMSLDKASAQTNGWESMEEVVCHVAKYTISKYGLKELGLPLTAPSEEASREAYFALFDMWLLRKSGASPEVTAARKLSRDPIFGQRPARVEDLQPLTDAAQVDRITMETARATEQFLRNLISRSLIEQATQLKQLENGAADALKSGTFEGQLKAQLLQAQMKRIMFRLASTWFRMKREVQTQVLRETMEWVLREAPSLGTEWLYAIASVENMGARIGAPTGAAGGATAENTPPSEANTGSGPSSLWQPRVFIKDDDRLNALVEQLRTRARDASTPRLLDSRLSAAWD